MLSRLCLLLFQTLTTITRSVCLQNSSNEIICLHVNTTNVNQSARWSPSSAWLQLKRLVPQIVSGPTKSKQLTTFNNPSEMNQWLRLNEAEHKQKQNHHSSSFLQLMESPSYSWTYATYQSPVLRAAKTGDMKGRRRNYNTIERSMSTCFSHIIIWNTNSEGERRSWAQCTTEREAHDAENTNIYKS